MAEAAARIAYVNLFAQDIDKLSAFYTKVFGFPELVSHRSPIYRCLDAGGVELGFNAEKAYELLGLADRKPAGRPTLRAYFTIEVGSREAVDDAVWPVERHGGRLLKGPYASYYNAWQAVFEDPEGNVFRVNHRMGPRPPVEELADKPWEG
jgi:predicted enzyme related to lactoylglutathione lyase